MKNIFDVNEYHKYKSTTSKDKNITNSSGHIVGPTSLGKIVIGIVIFALIFFIFNGASFDSISTLLAFGFIIYLFVQSISK